jgi:hypothetical protein
MGVVRVEIQTVEDIYRVIWTTVANRQPIEASYQGRYRLFCRTDWGEVGRESFCTLLPVRRRQPERTRPLDPLDLSANWRCVALEKLSRMKLVEGDWHTAPNHSRPASCVAEADIDAEGHPERTPQNGQ